MTHILGLIYNWNAKWQGGQLLLVLTASHVLLRMVGGKQEWPI